MVRRFYIPTEEEIKQLRRGKISSALFVFLVVIAVVIGCFMVTVDVFETEKAPDNSAIDNEATLFNYFDSEVINDMPYIPDSETKEKYQWVFSNSDLQLPELPTGCEATACSTLLRMHGVEVDKLEVADAMPRSDNPRDFMSCFIGDPYSSHGWAIASPGIAKVANKFLDNKEAVAIRGSAIEDIELPADVWVTISMVEPDLTDIADDGFPLYRNAHAVVLTSVDDSTVSVVDPLVGETTYERDRFEHVYMACGMQAVEIRRDKDR